MDDRETAAYFETIIIKLDDIISRLTIEEPEKAPQAPISRAGPVSREPYPEPLPELIPPLKKVRRVKNPNPPDPNQYDNDDEDDDREPTGGIPV